MKNCTRRLLCLFTLLVVLCVTVPSVFASQKVNINKATVAELVVLKGIGEKTAASIVEYRKTHGDFKQISALVNVKGVGDKTFAKLADQITVQDETPK